MATNLTPWNGLDVEKLKVWVHHILPLVYDDSLSYYEVLAKVSEKMNEVISGLNANNEQVEKVTGFTIEQVQNLTLAFNNFQQSMLTRQENFENTLHQDVNTWENQIEGDIANWKAETEEAFENQYNDFLTKYQKQFGVVQDIGDSTTDVMSQDAVSNLAFVTRGVGSGDDADTLIAPGCYEITNADMAHLPEAKMGTLLVFSIARDSLNWTVQMFVAYTYKAPAIMHWRVRFGDEWLAWKQFYTSDSVKQTIGNSTTDVMSQDAVSNLAFVTRGVGSGDDADTLIAPGCYEITNADMAHLPEAKMGTLLVFSIARDSLNWTVQMFVAYTYKKQAEYYVRVRFGGAWENWRKLQFEPRDVQTFSEKIPFYGKKIVLGGDSITHGQGGTGWAQTGDDIITVGDRTWKRSPNSYCWAKLFADLMTNEYGCTVINNGCTGTHSNFWASHISELLPEDTDIFILTVGTNDRSDGDATTVRTQILNSVRTIKAYCDAHNITFIYCSPIPASTTNETSLKVHMWNINDFVKNACLECNVAYYDLYNEAYYYYLNRDEEIGTYADELHPNDMMYWHMFYWYCKLLNIAPSVPAVDKP